MVTYFEDFLKEKYIRVMAHDSADGLWDKNGSMIEHDMLDDLIPEHVKNRILNWQRQYENSRNINEYYKKRDVAENVIDAELLNFSKEGFEIALELKRRLPDWEIVYFDLYKHWQLTKHERSVFEYVVPLAAPGYLYKHLKITYTSE